jgi:hypothetical protein
MIFLNASKWTDAQGDRPDPQLRSKPKKDYGQGRKPFSEIRAARPRVDIILKPTKLTSMGALSYRVLLKKDPEGFYSAIVPTLPGCVTFGETIDEPIEAYVESLVARDEEIP